MSSKSIRGYISYGLLKDDLAIKKEAKKNTKSSILREKEVHIEILRIDNTKEEKNE